MNPARPALSSLRARIRPGESVAILWLVAACSTALSIAGCQRAPSAAEAPAAEAKDKGAPEAEGVTLKPEEIEKAGIKTATLAAVSHAPESTGYALVITRETIAQAVADLTSAAAVERQSRSALTRARSLAGTPGAMPIEAQEAAERQAAVDNAAFVLGERRLSATYGQNAPWKENYHSPLLTSLARGETKLARVTFPLGALGSAVPAKLRLTHIGEAQGSKSMDTLAVWGAPADATIPGRSFFAILKSGDASEGERLIAHAAVGAAENGVVVPYSAAVISGGKYWCYVEEKPGVFVRTEVDPAMPTDEGYFVKEGIEPGAQVVTTSAGLLLARETNPSTAAD
jgi:multidrug efflux system membrane fusion protein